jgi:hypothetical protein
VTSSRFTAGHDDIVVRELTGRDEELVTSADSVSAIRLVSAVARDTSGGAVDAGRLATADRHRILATIYQLTFGNRVESTVVCFECKERFDIVFEIPEFLASANEDVSRPSVDNESIDRDNGYDLGHRLHVRAPTGDDELSVVDEGGDVGTLIMERCVVAGELEGRADEVRKRLAGLAPLLDVDLEPECPECGQRQKRRFDLQSYVLLAILQGRSHLMNDVHLIARAYHWTLDDILGLTRSHRCELLERIIVERSEASV